MKRQITIETVNNEDYMPPAKKSTSSKTKKWLSRKTAGPYRSLARSNSCIISRSVAYDVDFSTDVAKGFGFSPTKLWVNGTSTQSIAGASDLQMFDLVRVVKVEVTILPNMNVLTYAVGSVKNIPYVYHAYDPNDSTNPSLSEMEQMSTLKIDSLDHIIRRTIYPNLPSYSTYMVDVGKERKNQFVPPALDNPWFGYKCYADMTGLGAADGFRFAFKIFYECRASI